MKRFFDKVDMTYSCWLWRAGTRNGWGIFTVKGKNIQAHRFAYELMVEKIPEGMHLDHLCRVRNCVNPAHLDIVTIQENSRRTIHPLKTHCKKGHEYSPENTYNKLDGYRSCRKCLKIADDKFNGRVVIEH